MHNSRILEDRLQGLVHAASGYHQVLAANRQLYNEVQDLKGNLPASLSQMHRLIENLTDIAVSQGTSEFIVGSDRSFQDNLQNTLLWTL